MGRSGGAEASHGFLVVARCRSRAMVTPNHYGITAPTRTPALRSPPAPPVCGAPPSRSSTTICPGLGLGARGCSRYARNATPATAPVDVIASLTPSSRPMAATRLVFSPRLFGTLPTARCPRGRRRRAGSWLEAALIHEHRPVRVLLDPGQVPPPGLWTLFTGVDRLFFSSIPSLYPAAPGGSADADAISSNTARSVPPPQGRWCSEVQGLVQPPT